MLRHANHSRSGRRTRLTIASGAVVLFAMTTMGCGAPEGAAPASDGKGPNKPSVVAAFYPLAFVADRVAGDHAAVTDLTPPGGEAHDIELSPSQTRQVDDADVVLMIGGFQAAVDEAVASHRGAAVIDAAGLVDTLDATDEHVEHAGNSPTKESEHDHDGTEHEDHNHTHGPIDPHLWLDPTNLEPVATTLADQLAKADPDHGADYHKNADALVKDLKALDQEYSQTLKTCKTHTIVTTHEAFGYLARKYGLSQVAITGVDPESEPSPARLRAVEETVKRTDATTVFFENRADPKVADVLANQLGLATDILTPLETLNNPGEDYLSEMRSNLTALSKALACKTN